MSKTKSFEISRHLVWEAYKRVKANKGAAGVDNQSIADFELDLKDNLYKLWDRMSSGSYFPPTGETGNDSEIIRRTTSVRYSHGIRSNCPDGGQAEVGTGDRTTLSPGLLWISS